MTRRKQSGFSMLEMMIVMAIGLVLMAMVAPLVTTTLNMYRLRGAGGDFSNLLQTARMQAVTSDRYLPVNVIVGAPIAGIPYNAVLDANGSGAYDVGESATAFNPAIQVRPTAIGPNPVNLWNQFMPTVACCGAVAINPNAWAPPNGFAITFGARGLPCQATAAANGTCAYTTAGGLPIAYEIFMQNVVTGVWEAVTINPAGRIRQWHYDATTATWRALD